MGIEGIVSPQNEANLSNLLNEVNFSNHGFYFSLGE
jgi:hypothetical protein